MRMIHSSLTGHLGAAERAPRLDKRLLPLIFRIVGPAPVRLVLGNGKGYFASRCCASIHDVDPRSVDARRTPV